MRSPIIALIACAAPLLIAAQTAAPQHAPAAQQASSSAPAGSKANDVVCKKFPPPVGTRIGSRKICKTQAEWDFIRAQDQEVIDQALKKPHTSG